MKRIAKAKPASPTADKMTLLTSPIGRCLAGLLFVMILNISAIAGPKNEIGTVKALHDDCTGSEVRKISCARFIAGVASTLAFFADRARESKNDQSRTVFRAWGVCPTEPVSMDLMRKIFVAWAEKHPDAAHHHEQLGVMTSLQNVWPCKL